MGTDYTLEKLPDVSGLDLVEAGRYRGESAQEQNRRHVEQNGSMKNRMAGCWAEHKCLGVVLNI
jgi:hypothetical protein